MQRGHIERVDGIQAACDLVARDDEGKPYTVRYEAVNAMLLNEFLKEHGEVQELKNKSRCSLRAFRKLARSLN